MHQARWSTRTKRRLVPLDVAVLGPSGCGPLNRRMLVVVIFLTSRSSTLLCSMVSDSDGPSMPLWLVVRCLLVAVLCVLWPAVDVVAGPAAPLRSSTCRSRCRCCAGCSACGWSACANRDDATTRPIASASRARTSCGSRSMPPSNRCRTTSPPGRRSPARSAASTIVPVRADSRVQRRTAVVLLGAGGHRFDAEPWRRAAAPPGWRVVIAGLGERWEADGISSVGVVADVAPLLTHADVVVTAAGWASVADTVSCGARLVVVPERRPFDEQAVRAGGWPTPVWPSRSTRGRVPTRWPPCSRRPWPSTPTPGRRTTTAAGAVRAAQ